jgi:Domain of unknown function (DUF4381)
MMRVASILLAFSFAFFPGDFPEVKVQQQGQATLWLDRPADNPLSLKLSEKLTIFMRVDGELPLEVELTEKVRSSAGWQLEALGKATVIPLDNDKSVRWQQVFVATPLEPGAHPLQLPALQFTALGGQEQKVSWNPLMLEIKTRVAKVDITEVRDRTGIEDLPPAPAARPWWPWLLCAALLLAVFAALVWHRRRARPVQESPPGSAALRELAELDQLPTQSTDDLKLLCAGLSDVLRRYMEQRFRLPATRWTTSEFLTALVKAWPRDGVHQKMLADILHTCDLAKFAEVIPPQVESHQLIGAARQFVEKTATTMIPPIPSGGPATPLSPPGRGVAGEGNGLVTPGD